jgi:hypothetical protein
MPKDGDKKGCTRCNGCGFGNWVVQQGVCFKCNGSGVITYTEKQTHNDKCVQVREEQLKIIEQCAHDYQDNFDALHPERQAEFREVFDKEMQLRRTEWLKLKNGGWVYRWQPRKRGYWS